MTARSVLAAWGEWTDHDGQESAAPGGAVGQIALPSADRAAVGQIALPSGTSRPGAREGHATTATVTSPVAGAPPSMSRTPSSRTRSSVPGRACGTRTVMVRAPAS